MKIRLWRLLLAFLPWIIIEFWLVANFFSNGESIFLLAGSLTLTAFMCLFGSRFFLESIPIALKDLWDSNIISARSMDNLRVQSVSPEQISLEEGYIRFINDFEDYLNHEWQFVSGLIFSLIFWAIPSYYLTMNNYNFSNHYLDQLGYIIESISYFYLGVLAWRLWATGKMISGLSSRFDLIPKIGHPDNCGGFSPIGNLCLWNAFLVGIWGVLLSAWIVYAQIHPGSIPYGYLSVADSLLIVILVISLLFFFIPLWNVHKAMLFKQFEIKQKLWEIGVDINHIEYNLLNNARVMEPDKAEESRKRLELLRDKYFEWKNYPTWPFDTSIIKKLIITETVPILTISGVSEQAVKASSILVDILSKLWAGR